MKKSTIYTLGDIDFETGNWENIKHIEGEFPKKFTDSEAKRVLAIEINGKQRIERGDFDDYKNVRKVVFGDGVEEIGSRVYDYWPQKRPLEEVQFSDSVKKIGVSAFRDCGSLKRAIIGNGLEEMEYQLFYGCENLTLVVIGENVKVIGDDCLAKTGLEMLIIPPNVEEIKDEACEKCVNLEEVVLTNGLKKIGNFAFADTAIRCVELPDTIEKLGLGAFLNKDLREVYIPEGMKIESLCFGDIVDQLDLAQEGVSIKEKRKANMVVQKDINSMLRGKKEKEQ